MNCFRSILNVITFACQSIVGRTFIANYRMLKLVKSPVTLQTIPVYFHNLGELEQEAVTKILDFFNNLLAEPQNKSFLDQILVLKKVIFSNEFSVKREELSARKKIAILSFGPCHREFDFFVCLLTIARYNNNGHSFPVFYHLKRKTWDDVMEQLGTVKDLFNLTTYKLSQKITNEAVKERIISANLGGETLKKALFAYYKKSMRLCWKVLFSNELQIVSSFAYSRVFFNQDKLFVELYKELSESSFFEEYKQLIERYFKTVILVDAGKPSYKSGPFYYYQGNAVLLQFYLHHVNKPHLLIGDLIFYTSIFSNRNNLNEGVEKGNSLRDQFVKEWSSRD